MGINYNNIPITYELLKEQYVSLLEDYNKLLNKIEQDSTNEQDKYLCQKIIRDGIDSISNSEKVYISQLMDSKKDNKINSLLKSKNKLIALITEYKLRLLFLKLYSAYPKHKAKEQARKSFFRKFNKVSYDNMLNRYNTIAKKLEEDLPDFRQRDEQYVPFLSSWLNREIADL